MATIINKVLDLSYDSIDTCIPVNCHVLASTYYMVEDQLEIQLDQIENLSQKDKENRLRALSEQMKTRNNVYLFEKIKTHKIWKSKVFWERTLCQNIYYEVLEQIKNNLIQRNGGQPLKAALDAQLPEVLKIYLFCTIDDCISFKNRITKHEDQTPTDFSQSRSLDDQDGLLNIEISEVIFSKLLQIQFDMTSFDVPVQQVREIVQKFLDVPDLVDPSNTEIILSQIKTEEEKQRMISISQDHEQFTQTSMFHDHFETEQGNNILERSSLVYRAQNIENTFTRENSLSMAYHSFINDISKDDGERRQRRNTQTSLAFRASVGAKLLSTGRQPKRVSLLSQSDFLKRQDAKANREATTSMDFDNSVEIEKVENLNVFKIPLNQDGKKKDKSSSNKNIEGGSNKPDYDRSSSYLSKGKESRVYSKQQTGGETKRQSMTERFKEQFIPYKPPQPPQILNQKLDDKT